jgi:hypothetical protein
MWGFDRWYRHNELAKVITRIINRSTRCRVATQECRSTQRYERSTSVLVGPWNCGQVHIEGFTFGVTNDISERGVAVSIPRFCEWEDVLCGFWCDSPIFVRGRLRHQTQLGGTFWQVGIHLEEVIHHSGIENYEQLNSIASGLRVCSFDGFEAITRGLTQPPAFVR